MSKLKIERFAGREANVNAYIIHNATHAVVVDSLRNRAEAAELAEAVRASGRTLQAIFVTHGHPDHYIGSRTLKGGVPERAHSRRERGNQDRHDQLLDVDAKRRMARPAAADEAQEHGDAGRVRLRRAD
jgi:glyoxylase-like metal-dependent hydrolase (beta-lactamase superfamily II)